MNNIICEIKKFWIVKYAWVLLFSIFMFILADTSFYSVNVLTGTARLMICIIISLLIYFSTKSRGTNQKQLLILIVAVTSIILSSLLCNSIKSGLILIICMIPAYIISIRCPLRLFIYVYNKVIYFLAIWALFGYLLTLIQPEIIRLFPSMISDVRDFSVYNLIFSVAADNPYVIRNYGIFWEPGTYSIFLNISLFFNLFGINELDKRNIILLVISIVSTMSTLGIVCMMLLFATFLLSNNKITTFGMKVFFIAVFFVAFLITMLYGDEFLFHVFGKLTDEDNASTLTRTASVIYVTEAFLDNWLLGIGMENFNILQEEKCFNMATCTPLNWIAVYGVVAFLYIIGMLKFFMKFSTNVLSKCLFVMFGLIIFSTENFLQIPFVYYFIFEGYKSGKISYA